MTERLSRTYKLLWPFGILWPSEIPSSAAEQHTSTSLLSLLSPSSQELPCRHHRVLLDNLTLMLSSSVQVQTNKTCVCRKSQIPLKWFGVHPHTVFWPLMLQRNLGQLYLIFFNVAIHPPLPRWLLDFFLYLLTAIILIPSYFDVIFFLLISWNKTLRFQNEFYRMKRVSHYLFDYCFCSIYSFILWLNIANLFSIWFIFSFTFLSLFLCFRITSNIFFYIINLIFCNI